MSGVIRVFAEEANMYGCLPCPKCGSKFRWPTQPCHPKHPSSVLCDDCGFIEPIVFPGRGQI